MWTPILNPDQLPELGAREQTWLDFKGAPANDRREFAKDIAAMANALGGSLIIGAVGGSTLVRYELLTEDSAKVTANAYEEAARDWLRPKPVVSTQVLEREQGFVVVVNVEPFLGQVVGLCVVSKDSKLEKKDNAFQFPIRVGSHTVYLTPEQLPMFADPKIRRIALSLHHAKDQPVEIHQRLVRGGAGSLIIDASLGAVDDDANSVTFVNVKYAQSAPAKDIRVPLDFIVGACCGTNGKWQVYLEGRFEEYRGNEVSFIRS